MPSNHPYIGTTEAAYLMKVTPQRVRKLLRDGRIKGAYKINNDTWVIPLINGRVVVDRRDRGPKPRWTKPRQRHLTRIHVNKHLIARNHNLPLNQQVPIFAIDRPEGQVYAKKVTIRGTAQLVYSDKHCLCSGSKGWIETFDFVDLEAEEPYNPKWLKKPA